MNKKFSTAILLLIFNRPDVTKKVFEAIRKIKPEKLYIAADGPRVGKLYEKENCNKARKITEKIDWKCKVKRLYRNRNLGCKDAVGGAITWFFENVNEGIILEDDCLPSLSFFGYCESMLERYRDDRRIMVISGTNVVGKWKHNLQDYHFSNYGGICGWATWKRAWKYYDPSMKLWKTKAARESIKNILVNKYQYRVRLRQFEETYENKVNSWAYRWSFSKLLQSGLSVVPSRNLVTNIGFGPNATHTKSAAFSRSNQKRYEINLPTRINKIVVADREYDKKYFYITNNATWMGKLINLI